MRRASTSVVLGGWIGFLATLSAILFYAVLTLAQPGVPQLPFVFGEVARDVAVLAEWGNDGILFATGGCFMAAAIAIILATSFWMLQGADEGDRVPGERMAAIGLLAAGLLAFGLREVELFQFDSVAGLVVVVVLSLAAIAFDRLIEVEDMPEDDDFHQTAILIGREMARNVVRLPAASDTAPRDPGK